MTDKTQRTFLIAGTLVLATAGTGLTLFNNLNLESKQELLKSLPISFALAAAFTAGEIGFLWLHKVNEAVTKRWRKATTILFMILLACSMGFAFYQELSHVFEKQKGELTTRYVGKLFEQTKDGRTQRILARQNKIDIQMPDAMAFYICYVLSAISYVVAGACYEKKRRRFRDGNIINQPQVRQAVERKIGFVDDTVTAYRDPKSNGVQYRINSQYSGFIKEKEMQ